MMPVKIVYPVPCESPEVWSTFKPFAERFVETYFKHPAGYPHLVAVVVNVAKGGTVPVEIVKLFEGIAVEYVLYEGNGMDLGSQQLVAQEGDHFQVNLTSRIYAHREGWLKRLVQARETYGPGLYGMSASYEGGRLHLATRGHSYDSKDFREYPHKITSRDQGVFFECGDGCLLEWYQSRKQPCFVATWDNLFGMGKCLHCGQPHADSLSSYFLSENRFRHGNQEQTLLFDKHTDAWRDASTEEKTRLTTMSLG